MKAHHEFLIKSWCRWWALRCAECRSCCRRSKPRQPPADAADGHHHRSVEGTSAAGSDAESARTAAHRLPGQDSDLTQNPQPATPPPQTKAEPQQQPLGAATAEGVPTVGGGASRPAGEAIAPAKQNQRRSLLLKLGVIAAVGVAGGTVYALVERHVGQAVMDGAE